MANVVPRFKAENKNGAIIFQDSEIVRQYVRNLEKNIAVVITNYYTKQKRSNQENRYYWGVVLSILSEYTGYSPEECHEICKHKFLMNEHLMQLSVGQEEILIPKSTTKLTTVEFEQYLSRIREWMSVDLSLYVPLPNEVSY